MAVASRPAVAVEAVAVRRAVAAVAVEAMRRAVAAVAGGVADGMTVDGSGDVPESGRRERGRA